MYIEHLDYIIFVRMYLQQKAESTCEIICLFIKNLV